MKTDLNIKVDLIRNIPFLLDSILEIGIGIIILTKTSLIILGWGILIVGIIQLIRKIKTFHLTDTELIVKRPLFPFKITEERFTISDIKQVRLHRIKGRFGGPHISIVGNNKSEDFQIGISKNSIDQFEIRLKSLGILTDRNGI